MGETTGWVRRGVGAGLRAGIPVAVVAGILHAIVLVLSRDAVIAELETAVATQPELPYGVETLYYLTLVSAPPITVVVYLLAAIGFGLVVARSLVDRRRIVTYGSAILLALVFTAVWEIRLSTASLAVVNGGLWLGFAWLFLYVWNASSRQPRAWRRLVGPGARVRSVRDVRSRRLAVFGTTLVLASSVVVALASALGVPVVVLAQLYMFAPLLGGLAVCLVFGLSPTRYGLVHRADRWTAVAWLAPVPFTAVVLLASVGLPDAASDFGGEIGPGMTVADLGVGLGIPGGVAVLIIASLLAGGTINAVFGLGEEFGWRGYLLTELRDLGFWRVSLVVGVVWGLWHAPVVAAGHNYPTNPELGILAMIALSVLLSGPFTYVTLRARTVVAPAIMHGTFNAVAPLSILFVEGYSTFVIGATGVVGMAVLLGCNLALALIGTPSLESPWAETEHASETPR